MPGLPERITERLRIPVIAAPMLAVSGPDLVTATCAAGVIGAFPTANAGSADQLDQWLSNIATRARGAAPTFAPWAANVIMRSPRLREDLAVLVDHRIPIVITSVGSPEPVVEALHAVGTTVFSDVASLHHVRRALDAGADGLILLAAGAGGQSGHLNPFAFVRAVREFYGGPVVLAGGLCDGHALRAAQVLGCDLGYVGTPFIATRESMASPDYQRLLVESSLDDIVLTRAFTGLPTNMLVSSIVAAGFDPDRLDEQVTPAQSRQLYGGSDTPRKWIDLHSAGHSVSSVHAVMGAGELVAKLAAEYAAAHPADARTPSSG
ncbi:nitronate monooxygenase [Mycobacterium sp. CVI_P3]|uniref:Nitronate monooxygenase n=1 Tax=Mycobacterium pinniadriaticum TaxID=2994102 RepID=A0ABT3SAD1_9MYCO|nr:nitronate monooxygenase [Mycobacterium pinniadriaticum]MCX2929884.1 nitronate monooxygenase [Mycobacterium pinniadriaticum]MCX2936467.1 nitronate monooxygenase [Mycobacterium pinniadriaticum]